MIKFPIKKKTEEHLLAEKIFNQVKIDKVKECTWIRECHDPVIGLGIFCDPIHKFCLVAAVCERHGQEHLHNLKIALETGKLYG